MSLLSIVAVLAIPALASCITVPTAPCKPKCLCDYKQEDIQGLIPDDFQLNLNGRPPCAIKSFEYQCNAEQTAEKCSMEKKRCEPFFGISVFGEPVWIFSGSTVQECSCKLPGRYCNSVKILQCKQKYRIVKFWGRHIETRACKLFYFFQCCGCETCCEDEPIKILEA